MTAINPGHSNGHGIFVDDAPRAGLDVPMANGCWRCIGCGKLLPRSRDWNQCSDCDTRDHEGYC